MFSSSSRKYTNSDAKIVEWFDESLAHFWRMLLFYTPWKHQKTFGFLVFSGSIKREHWPEMG